MKIRKATVPAAVLAVIILGAVWYFSPKVFLKNVSNIEIAKIEVFDGSTGREFEICGEDEISLIADNIRKSSLERDGLCIGYMGYSFRLDFYNENGKKLEGFTVNSQEMIRGSVFFYKSQSGDLCYDYLEQLEEKYTASKSG